MQRPDSSPVMDYIPAAKCEFSYPHYGIHNDQHTHCKYTHSVVSCHGIKSLCDLEGGGDAVDCLRNPAGPARGVCCALAMMIVAATVLALLVFAIDALVGK